MVPDGRRDDAAGPHHAAHLGDRLVGLGHEMEDEERQGAVEPAVRERNGAGIALRDRDPRIRVPPLRLRDEHGRIVDRRDLGHVGCRRQREGQAAGAAADVEHPLAVRDAGEVDERPRQHPAPAAHEPLVAGGAADGEARAHGTSIATTPSCSAARRPCATQRAHAGENSAATLAS